jgi:hypothetical protein
MALLWIDGFEGYGTTLNADPAPVDVLGRRYPIANTPTGMEIKEGRFGGRAIYFWNSTCQLKTPELTTDDTLIVGVATKREINNDIYPISMCDGITLGMNIRIPGGQSEIYIYRGNSLVEITSGANIGIGTWHHIEFKVKCHDSNGEYELKVDGISITSATSVDTKAGANTYHNSVKLMVPSSHGHPTWDDLWICDSTGSQNNDFLGNQRVSAIFPGGPDDIAGWETSVPVGNHYETVDEEQVDDDTSYIEDDDSGDKDLWNYGSVPTYGQIQGLQINTDCKETDATDFTLITVIKSGGTEYDDSPQAAGSGDWITLRRIAELDPDTGALWTESGINNGIFGVKVG